MPDHDPERGPRTQGTVETHAGEGENQVPEVIPPEAMHEETDVNVWAVGKFGIALALFCILALLGVAGLLKYFVSHNALPPPAGLNVDARRLPPEPRLEVSEPTDLAAMRAAEDQILDTYGWVDRQHGIVRIPIERAMDLLAARGLPSLPQPEPRSASNAIVPTESGLGPIMQQPGGPLAPELYPPQNGVK